MNWYVNKIPIRIVNCNSHAHTHWKNHAIGVYCIIMRNILPRSFLVERYILRALAGPFFFSLTTLMFVFLLQFIMKFIDQLAGKGLTPLVIIELIALSLAWMLVLAVPMSVLVAVLMAFGDMASRNEITAMKAGGISTYRMLLPAGMAALVIAGLLVVFNNHVLPETNHRLKSLTQDIHRKRPTLNLRDGVFSNDLPGYSMLVRKTFEKSNDLEGVTLFDYTNPGLSVVITAERGKISFSPDYHKIVLDLDAGEIHQLDLQQMTGYRRIRFTQHRIAMNVENFDFTRQSESMVNRGDRELGAPAMLAIVDSVQILRDSLASRLRLLIARAPGFDPGLIDSTRTIGTNQTAQHDLRSVATMISNEVYRIETYDKQIDQYMVEVHKKYAIPAACLVFVLVGVPLGIMARRGGFGMAATLSLGFFLLYYAFLIGGEKLADRDLLSPMAGMWSANVIIGIAGILLTIRTARETIVIDWSFLLRLLPARLRSTDHDASGDVA
jgi:lipopolysaccharide export system permease protein